MVKSTALAAIAVVLGAAGVANAGTINFDSDSTGGKTNGFTSVDSAIVHFTDTVGADLSVLSLAESNFSQALVVFNDGDGSKLQMDFDAYQQSLSLDFGNDDPGFTSAGDLAILQLFDGATLVGQVTVVLNRNDLMDQTISYSGASFNQAFFYYGDAALTPFTHGGLTGLIEVVDNITFTSVPLPGSAWMGMSLLGAIGAFSITRRRKS